MVEVAPLTRTQVPLRELAASGCLSQVASTAPAELARLRMEAFEVVFPLVWERHTSPLESRKGHRGCATAVNRLAPECLDGFTDDLEAVVNALMAYRRPIASLEGWITTRMANAIKDGYRVRRAREMGAQQRVRVPAGLALRLGGDRWLVMLAERVLQWTGVRQAAGSDVWPLDRWAEDRAKVKGESSAASVTAVSADLMTLLSAMREWDATWYEKYVERPLGRKWAPVAAARLHQREQPAEENLSLELVPRHEREDARLAAAAASCLDVIRARLAGGRDLRVAVEEALAESYLSADWTLWDMEHVPVPEQGVCDVVEAVLEDPDALDRVVGTVLGILSQGGRQAGGPSSAGGRRLR